MHTLTSCVRLVILNSRSAGGGGGGGLLERVQKKKKKKKKKRKKKNKRSGFGSHYNNLTVTLPGLEGCQCRSHDHFFPPAY